MEPQVHREQDASISSRAGSWNLATFCSSTMVPSTWSSAPIAETAIAQRWTNSVRLCDADKLFLSPQYSSRLCNSGRAVQINESVTAIEPFGLALKTIARLEIPLPPLAEQRRIAEVLDRAEALRAKRRAALAQLDSLTQSIFLDLFGDPVANPKSGRRSAWRRSVA